MDLHPTFGHTEFLETLSVGSLTASRRSTGSSVNGGGNRSGMHHNRGSVTGGGASVGGGTHSGGGSTACRSRSTGSSERGGPSRSNSHHPYDRSSPAANANAYANSGSSVASLGQTTQASSHVDDAYRRLGHRLSIQAHGEDPNARRGAVPPPRLLVTSRGTSFGPYRRRKASESRSIHGSGENNNDYRYNVDKGMSVEQESRGEVESSGAGNSNRYRTSKVAKKWYSDHGEHVMNSPRPSNSLLKRLTYHAKDSFRLWEQTQQISQKKAAATRQEQQQPQQQHLHLEGSLSPQRYAFSKLALAGSHKKGSSAGRSGEGESKGLLSSVLEGHAESTTSASGPLRPSSPSQSISTKDSRTVSTLGGMESMASNSLPPQARGQCLTVPAEPNANDGMDNVEGNLIVFENDVINIPRKSLHTVNAGEKGKLRSAEYRIRGALGQGTFAQVFLCLHVQSGREVAVKIVKNKPAYTRQATVEIDVFRALQEDKSTTVPDTDEGQAPPDRDYMVKLLCYFMHQSHLCLVFELLGLNLYEVLKRRQFRGLPLPLVRTIVMQSVEGIRQLSQKKNVVHCDLKPENVLLISDDVVETFVHAGDVRRSSTPEVTPRLKELFAETSVSTGSRVTSSGASSDGNTANVGNMEAALLAGTIPARQIKLIDFGSACFEGYTAHTYIQSRFYRSPEVLVGLPYDSAIDMWSMGCIAAELFLGLPILPGVHEHDQLGRINEMIGKIPDWMLEQGSKSTKYHVKFVSRPSQPEHAAVQSSSPGNPNSGSPPLPLLPQWRLKTQQEYITSLSQSEIKKKGGLAKLQKQPGNRYFKLQKLADILMLHAKNISVEEKDALSSFVHFLYGVLDPDPWKRWTAFQALQHPFLIGDFGQFRRKSDEMKLDSKEENQANLKLDLYWQAPWDPAICRRKLLNVQKMREQQQALRKNVSSRPHNHINVGSEMNELAERRLGRIGEPSLGGIVPMTGPEEASHRYSKGGVSPPCQVSQSGSSSESRQHTGPAGGFMGKQQGQYSLSSSLTSLGNPGSNAQLAMDSSSVTGHAMIAKTDRGLSAGAQSSTFSGYETTRVPIEGDFAHALQRPGVVPAGVRTDASLSSQAQSNASFSSGSGGIPRALPGQGKGMNQGSGHYGNQGPSPSGSSSALYGSSQYGTAATLPSTSMGSSVTMQDVPLPGNSAQGTPYMDPQQLAFLQQNQQQAGMQQAGGQQAPLLLQQQPVYLAPGAPGGGYYYVTTSATGQPIILQPVSMPNQQEDQAGTYPVDQPNQAYGIQQQFQQQNPQFQQQLYQQPNQQHQQQFQQPNQHQQYQQQNQHQQHQQPNQQYQQPNQQYQQPNQQYQQPTQQYQQPNLQYQQPNQQYQQTNQLYQQPNQQYQQPNQQYQEPNQQYQQPNQQYRQPNQQYQQPNQQYQQPNANDQYQQQPQEPSRMAPPRKPARDRYSSSVSSM
jgi:serine/threonine protein kinase